MSDELSTAEALELTGLTNPRGLFRALERGEIKADRQGREWRFSKASILKRPRKFCYHCDRELDLELGFSRRTLSADGRQNWCKGCISASEATRDHRIDKDIPSEEEVYRRNKSRYEHSRKKPRYCPGKLPWNDEECGARLRYDQHANRKLCDPCERRERDRHERRKGEMEAA